MKQTILVTGGAGYIGSHTCKAVGKAGFIPISYDNLIYGHEDAVKWGPFIKGDLFDSEELDRVFKEFTPIAVIHFAAFAYVGESMSDPGKYYRNNVAGTINLLEAMRRNGCRNFIFSSTCATFGIPGQLPVTERTPQAPVNPYGRSKLMIEHILDDFDRGYGLKYIVLRYFNAAGADPELETGERHDPETHLIPLAIEAALGNRQWLEIFGTDYDTPDGTAVRDYIHVTDLATAHVKAMHLLLDTNRSHSFNLGTGKGTSVKEILDVIAKVSGRNVPVIYSPRRAGDPPILIAGAEKAAKILTWRPVFSRIESIIETAWRYHCQQDRAKAVN